VLLIERFNAEKRKAEAEQQYTKYREETSKRMASANRNMYRSARELDAKISSVREFADQSSMQLKQVIEEASSKKFMELPRSSIRETPLRRCLTIAHHAGKQDDVTTISTQLLLKKIESDTGVEANDLSRYFKTISAINS